MRPWNKCSIRKPTSRRSLFEKKEGKQMRQTSKQESEPGLTEPEAIRRAQSGDAAAFEHLCRSHSKHEYSVCMRMLKNTADAEDMTQQVFLQMFRRIGTFRGEEMGRAKV